MNEALNFLDETGRWRARDVRYWEGPWDRLRLQLPEFRKEDFRAQENSPPNPYMQSVVRLPRTQAEQLIPVGVVSNTYTLAQHREVAEKCLEGIRTAGIDTLNLKCQVGLTELGEWMNLRIYFPKSYEHTPGDGQKLGLRLECFNSVDGSSRLVLLLSWWRLICSNGMVIRKTKAEFKDIHNKHMDLKRIPKIVSKGLALVEEDRAQLVVWENSKVNANQLIPWADKILPKAWGKKASCRAFHICTSGFDVEYKDPFAKGDPTNKPVKRILRVPGAPDVAKNLYDVSQALSWIASARPNSDERVAWQSQIPDLVERLSGVTAVHDTEAESA